jgi:hypothetical protein
MVALSKIEDSLVRVLILQTRDAATEHDRHLGHALGCLERWQRDVLRRWVIDHSGLVYHGIYFGLRVVVVNVVRLGKRGQVLLLYVHLPALQVLFRFLNNDWCGLMRRGIVVYALLGVLYRLELLPLARVLTRLE